MNKSLFSQHFLETRLADQPEWQEDAQPIFDQVRVLWQHARQYAATWNEAQTEDEFVKPVLEALGWSYIVQTKSLSRGRVSRPDYALFLDPTSKNAAYPLQGDDDAFYSRPPVIGEAKYWQRELSKKDADRRDDWKASSNPSHQMVSYLVGTRVAWGILTNGAVWRLYSREVSSTASEYYEFDLSTLFDDRAVGARHASPLQHFKRWWLFFRRAAFAPSAQGKSFIQRMHDGSTTYAREISDKLKELVFDEVMPEIAGGFIAYRHQEQGIAQESEPDLRQIYQASLSLLYKLLFLLYGEARNLLPMQNPSYAEQSLTEMARWAADKRDRQQPLSRGTRATPKYAALLALFHRVDRGDADLSIPRYNGGLFNPANPDNLFLAEHRLSDYAVATTVDILVRDAGEPVDYAYISVRNLGAIYEGLLENKLRVLDPAIGKVELINDKGERKASGSYYTPDYIVQYIVQQTLDPILDERQPHFNAAMDQCVALRRRLQTRAAEQTGVNQLLRSELAKAERAARESFLGIKTCDPAMGSGHFLVNAVDHLTDGIIDRMLAYHAAHVDAPLAWNPIYVQIDAVRQEIVAEMQRQGITVNPDQLDDTALLTRLVMKRCVYGVDLNAMAVELAKLSLWLHSFTVGAPLSFLDHHLRWGNSLIGSDVRTVEAALLSTKQTKGISPAAKKLAAGRGEKASAEKVIYQVNLFGGPFAGLLDLTAIMLEIAQQADSTLADVHESAEKFNLFQASLLPYKQALDLWVSQLFGNTDATEFLETYPTDVLPALRGERKLTRQHLAAIEQAKALWVEKRFFHWDLEFPEVFIDLERRDWAENPGFDAVIGNPPYANAWRMTDLDLVSRQAIEVLNRALQLLHGHWDLYAAFFTKALNIVREQGYHSFIIPDAFAREKYALAMREYLLKNTTLCELMHFEGINVFDDVSRHCLIYVIYKAQPMADAQTKVVIPIVSGMKAIEQGRIPQSEWLLSEGSQIRVELANYETLELIHKIKTNAIKVGQFCYVMVGATTHSKDQKSFTKATIISDTPIGNAKRFFDGKNVSRYFIEWDGRYLDYRRNEMYGPRVPELFESPKLIVRDVTGANEQLIVSYDNSGLYCDHLVTCVTYYENVENTQVQTRFEGFDRLQPPYPDLLYLTSVLATKLMTWFFRQVFATGTLQGSYSHTYPQQVRSLPIPRITFTTPAADRARYAEQGQQFYAQADYAAVLGFVDHHLAQQPEQADVVHDLLAFLAEQMIDLNKQKQTEMKGFSSGWNGRSASPSTN